MKNILALCLVVVSQAFSMPSEANSCDAIDSETAFLHGFQKIKSNSHEEGVYCLKRAADNGHDFSGLFLAAYFHSIGNTTDSLKYLSSAKGLRAKVVIALANYERALYPNEKKMSGNTPDLHDWVSGDPYNYVEAAKWTRIIFLITNNGLGGYISPYRRLSTITNCVNFPPAEEAKQNIISVLSDREKRILESALSVDNGGDFKSDESGCESFKVPSSGSGK